MCKENSVFDLLLAKNITVATAESCTGGLLGAAFTDYPGISAVYLEGAITYANEAKIRLGVLPETLMAHGAVSAETAAEMAEAARKRAGAAIGISTTGIAGPGGGSEKKPVGLVFVGIATAEKTKTYALRLSGDRDAVRRKTVSLCLYLLQKWL